MAGSGLRLAVLMSSRGAVRRNRILIRVTQLCRDGLAFALGKNQIIQIDLLKYGFHHFLLFTTLK